MSLLRKRQIWIIFFCLYVSAVAYLCFMRPSEMPEISPDLWGIPLDKIVHFIMFFPYPILSYGAFRPKNAETKVHVAVLLIVCATGLGLAMATEQIQGTLEYRSKDMEDFLADFMGINISALITLIYILIFRKK